MTLHLKIFPFDIQELIEFHLCASIIQSRWRRFFHYGYTRRKRWSFVRQRLCDNVFRILVQYPNIRREWRVEPYQWEHIHNTDICKIMNEVLDGLWGNATKSMQTNFHQVMINANTPT